jgi:hypothetical protein
VLDTLIVPASVSGLNVQALDLPFDPFTVCEANVTVDFARTTSPLWHTSFAASNVLHVHPFASASANVTGLACRVQDPDEAAHAFAVNAPPLPLFVNCAPTIAVVTITVATTTRPNPPALVPPPQPAI